MKFISIMYEKAAVDRSKLLASTPFVRITYSETFEIWRRRLDGKVEWGNDLASKHERVSQYQRCNFISQIPM
uniref:Uncharacterized protein n=1 Tax=Physcomitrium patens TaxID=3218 RepID=A0A2K1KP62_PHYPA|nr:hypothetical protein PHYPA_006469 [Physcomitrium patens]